MDSVNIIQPFIISNLFATIFLVLAYERTTIARLILAVLFWSAGLTNLYVSHDRPEVYLEYSHAASELYARFIQGWFSKHITLSVTLIAVAQLIIATGVCFKEKIANLSATGAIIFFIAISPLGIYAAFPFPVISSIGCLFIIL